MKNTKLKIRCNAPETFIPVEREKKEYSLKTGKLPICLKKSGIIPEYFRKNALFSILSVSVRKIHYNFAKITGFACKKLINTGFYGLFNAFIVPHRLSVVHHKLSVVAYRTFLYNHRASAVAHRTSVVHHKFSVVFIGCLCLLTEFLWLFTKFLLTPANFLWSPQKPCGRPQRLCGFQYIYNLLIL